MKLAIVAFLLVVSAPSFAQKFEVKILDRQDNETDYSYVVPGHFTSYLMQVRIATYTTVAPVATVPLRPTAAVRLAIKCLTTFGDQRSLFCCPMGEV